MAKQISDIETVRLLVNHLALGFVSDIVIVPGASNAPISVSLARIPCFHCHTILDARAAGFFALGMAQLAIPPVALICPNGTALLNCAPAIAEAYYQHLPLIVVTADRPEEWLNQNDGHMVEQQEALAPFFKYRCQVPSSISCDDERWYANRIMREAVNASSQNPNGPVHINIPIREPLGNFNTPPSMRISGALPIAPLKSNSELSMKSLCRNFNERKRIMVVIGPMLRSFDVGEFVMKMEKNYDVVVVHENMSNLVCGKGVKHIDRVLATITPEEENAFLPDLVITCGGAVSSRKLQEFIRKGRLTKTWHIGEEAYAPDTFKSLSVHIPMQPDSFFDQFIKAQGKKRKRSKFHQLWETKVQIAEQRHKAFIENAPWSDLKAFSIIAQTQPEESDLQLGTSTPMRYMDLFDYTIIGYTWGNCGTHGIEGCLSTATGFTLKTHNTVTVILGDNSFLYDSNALLIAELPTALKIIVIDNEGGSSYRISPETSQIEEVRELCELPHEQDIARIAKAYGLKVLKAQDEDSLQMALKELYAPQDLPALLVVKTPAHMNGEVLRQYFQYMREA